MVKSFNINLVIILTALVTSIGTAPVWDDDAILSDARRMIKCARNVVNHRKGALDKPFLGHGPEDVETYIITQIAKAVSKSLPLFSPFTEQQLLQEPDVSMGPTQVHYTRAYHSLVFEKLKTLFEKIHDRKNKQPDSEILKTGLDCVASYSLRHHDLERKWWERLVELSTKTDLDRPLFSKWRKLELPEYDWERVRNIPLPTFHDVTTGGMLESLRRRIQNVVADRTRIKRKKNLNLQTDLDPKSYVVKRIAQIRLDSRPFPFTKKQLLENPNAHMPPDQLQLTRAYHCLVFEELRTFFETVRDHLGAHENIGRLEEALAEVGRALKMHQNLESQYGEILERIQDKGIRWHKSLRLPEYDWPYLDRIIRMQSPPEDQNYAYNDEPISAHGPGCGLQASTSQPGPSVVARIKQPVLIDFLGIADATVEATSELAPRFGHSHDDRDPLTDDRFSNELCRPPGDHCQELTFGRLHILRPPIFDVGMKGGTHDDV
ncbi:hypothetical protein SeMB42_g07088 [Synchytrium endobioticum]|uniref:Hemerythrin-like domain-containing protein n=1 Tax=Synchytrium endobioticum TaxID=286115 RepID=A0A507CET7_9FUNG|nr:hypothetical protein SeMB42_g07088 [Synchytrium endobioticum]